MENLAAVGFLWASSTRIAIDVGVRPLSAIWAARKRTRPRRRVASAKVDYNPPYTPGRALRRLSSPLCINIAQRPLSVEYSESTPL